MLVNSLKWDVIMNTDINKRNFSLNALNKALIIVLIILLATCIKVYPLYQYSLEPGSYDGYTTSLNNHLLENGHSLPAQRGELLLDKLYAIKTLVINPSKKQNLLIDSLFLSLTFSLVLLLFANKASKDNITSEIQTGLVTAFSICAVPGVILRLSGWNGPYAWIYMMIAFYFIIFKQKCARNSLFFLLVLLLPVTYFTDSLLLLIIMGVAFVFQIITKKEIFTKNLILVYGIFLFAWLLYMSVSGFNSLFRIGDFIHLYLQGESRIQLLDSVASGSSASMIKNTISIFFACIPYAYLLIYGKRIFDSRVYGFFIVTLLAISIMSLFLFAWMGFTGIIQRVPLYVVVFSILSFSILITSKIQKQHLKILTVLALIAIVFSNYTYITREYPPSSPSFGEAEGIYWLMNKASNDDLIFTDFRLSGLFTAHQFITIGIPDNVLPPKMVNKLLDQIFYSEDSPVEAFYQLSYQGRPVRYIVFSNIYKKRFPGIMGYDYNFLPAPDNFLEKYEKEDEFNKIYLNDDLVVFKFG